MVAARAAATSSISTLSTPGSVAPSSTSGIAPVGQQRDLVGRRRDVDQQHAVGLPAGDVAEQRAPPVVEVRPAAGSGRGCPVSANVRSTPSRTWAKYQRSMIGHDDRHPRPVGRPSVAATYPRSSAACSTLRRVAAEIDRCPCSARDTVAAETPATAATSRTVVAIAHLPGARYRRREGEAIRTVTRRGEPAPSGTRPAGTGGATGSSVSGVIGRYPIIDIGPVVEGGRYPVKAVVGRRSRSPPPPSARATTP